jgi:hypothetical protein
VSSVVKDFPKAFTTEDTEATEQTKNETAQPRQPPIYRRCFTGQLSAGNGCFLWSISVNSVRSVVKGFLEGTPHTRQ